MPSTREEKAKEKRSRQSDVMSDLEKMNVMLGNYPGNRSDEDLNENIEIDSRSNGTRTDVARNCEDFRSLLNTEDGIENEVTVDTSRFISTEILQQVSRKLDELKRDLNTQITESINSAIQKTILPSLQNSLSGPNSGLGTNVDARSSRLSRNTEDKKHQSAWGNTQNPIQTNSHNHPHSRGNSLSSLDCRDDHDRGLFSPVRFCRLRLNVKTESGTLCTEFAMALVLTLGGFSIVPKKWTDQCDVCGLKKKSDCYRRAFFP